MEPTSDVGCSSFGMVASQRSAVARDWRWLTLVVVLLLASCGRAADRGATAPAATASASAADPDGCPILVGVEIPAAGCREITGHLRGATLSFVVRVG